MSELATSPDQVLEETPSFKTLISEYENGAEQRRAKWSTPLREFRLIFRNRTATEYAEALDFFKSKLGAYTSFTWTNPNDSIEYTVRYKDDSIKFTRTAYQVYSYEYALVVVK